MTKNQVVTDWFARLIYRLAAKLMVYLRFMARLIEQDPLTILVVIPFLP